ncbi:helix-turn-helix transcriptional regulator [Nocardioides sp. LHD-245]|uniref:helix-turn-helix transcriptional regulator n=1 Tax=Nocardioides sp. LHD-245 TaxID=3051387 RepID=UPI0037094264
MTTPTRPHHESNPDPLLDLAQAAAYLTLSERTVRRLVASGQLGCIQLSPRKMRIRRSELERYVSASTTGATR